MQLVHLYACTCMHVHVCMYVCMECITCVCNVLHASMSILVVANVFYFLPISCITTCMAHAVNTIVDLYSQEEFAWLKDIVMLWHDNLSLWWAKSAQEWLAENYKCPIEGWPDRTWADRQVHFVGEYNRKVVEDIGAGYYDGKLPGDEPAFMCLDNRLIHDIKEAAHNNTMLTMWMKDKDEDGNLNPEKYSFGTPERVQSALQRTIDSGVPTPKRIRHDFHGVFDDAIPACLNSEGTYIDDTVGGRHGHRAARASAFIRDRDIGPNQDALQKFFDFAGKVRAGEGVESMKLEGGGVVVEDAAPELTLGGPPDADEEQAGAGAI
jgi:hypothetical protein